MPPLISNVRVPAELAGTGPSTGNVISGSTPGHCLSCRKPTTNSKSLSSLRRAFCYTCWYPYEVAAAQHGVPTEEFVQRTISAVGGRAQIVPPSGPYPMRNCQKCGEPQPGSTAVAPEEGEVVTCFACLDALKPGDPRAPAGRAG